MLIPVCMKPYEDELFYGYLLRLAKENFYPDCGSLVDKFINTYLYVGEKRPETAENGSFHRLDCIPGLDAVIQRYGHMKVFPDVEQILGRMTPIYVQNLMRPYGYQVQVSQYFLRERTGGILELPHTKGEIQELVVCPACMKEDKEKHGEAYYHTWHHFPGVKICAKHRIPLRFVEKRENGFLDDPKTLERLNEKEPDGTEGTEFRYASFLYGLYLDTPVTDFQGTKLAVLKRLVELGYPMDYPYGALKTDMEKQGYGGMFAEDPAKKMRRLFAQNHFPLKDGFILLSFLFSDVSEFTKKLPNDKEERFKEFLAVAGGRFRLMSPYGNTVLLQCLECGDVFYIHPYAIELGCGCPRCDRRMEPQSYINRQLSCIGDGAYELAEPFKGYGIKHKIRHRTCGKVAEANLSEKIWFEKTCACEFGLSLQEIQERVDPTGNTFRLIHYERGRGGNQNITLEHMTCKGVFTLGLRSFLENPPYCRVCGEGNPYREAFAKKVHDVTGDEYELLEPYRNERTPVTIRHRACGVTMRAFPYNFLKGKRCELCTPIIKKEEMKDIIPACTGGAYQVASILKNTIIVRDPDGVMREERVQYFMQELMRPTPSDYFKVRTAKPELPERLLGKCYRQVKDWCEGHKVWFMAEHMKEDAEYKSIKIRLATLVKMGYLQRIWNGAFNLGEDVSMEDYLRERYLEQGDRTTGLYAYESAAWHYAGIGEKPKEECLFYNEESSPDARKRKVFGETIRIRKSPVPINDANKEVLIGLNLLLYLVRHPEDSAAVKEYLDSKGLTMEQMRYYIGSYPSWIKKAIRQLETIENSEEGK